MWMALSVCPLGPSQKFLILHKLYSRREHFSTSVRALRWQTRTRWEVSLLKWINLHKFLLQGSHYLKKSPSPTGIKSPPGCCLEPNNETSLSPCDEIINGRPLISPSPQVLWCITKKLHGILDWLHLFLSIIFKTQNLTQQNPLGCHRRTVF